MRIYLESSRVVRFIETQPAPSLGQTEYKLWKSSGPSAPKRARRLLSHTQIPTEVISESLALQGPQALRAASNDGRARDRGKPRKASRIESLIRKLMAGAIKGDVSSAGELLKLRAHAEKYGDGGRLIVRVMGGLPRG
jgi:hypothetical protein